MANGVPDLLGSLTAGIQAGQAIRQAPLLEELTQQRVATGQRQSQAEQLALGQQRAQILSRIIPVLKDIPQAERQAFLEQNQQLLGSVGIPSNVGVIDDASLDRVLGAAQAFGTGINPTNVQSSESLPGGITKLVTRDGQVIVKDASNRVISGEDAKNIVAQAEERKIDLAKQKASEVAIGKGVGVRGQEAINIGLEAAKGIPTLKRTIALLDDVQTGGFDAAALRAKQLFGVEGADEGELSANLGQAILGDLRATFGAAFTEREGARLERIRANFGKSPETNKRLIRQSLQLAERAARRGLEEAKSVDDFGTAQEILDLIDFQFDFTDIDQQAQPATFEGFEILNIRPE
jgi:hypothetical protein